MNLDQIREVATRYKEILPEGKKSDLQHTFPLSRESAEHCSWMCDQIISKDFDRDKAMRWLCFVQGCLWILGLRSVDNMREDNRS